MLICLTDYTAKSEEKADIFPAHSSMNVLTGNWFNMKRAGLGVLIIAVFLLPLIPVAGAQNPVFGVNLTCDSPAEMDVSPAGYAPVEMVCTIENTATVGASKIEITNEWNGGATADMLGATGEYSVEAGESEEFTVTFSGTTKQASSNSYEFDIFATVTEWNSIPLNEPFPRENDSFSDSLEIATYGAVELRINDVSTRKVESGSEFSINLQFTNKGNDNDRVRVDIANINDLKQQGFSFIGSEFVAEDLAMGATSTMREIKILAPDDLDTTTNFDFQFQASSTNDANADLSETMIPVSVESTQSSGTLTGGISEVGEDDLMLYGAIAGGIILFLLLIGIVSRSIRKRAAKKVTEEPTIELDEPEQDEFDDLFSDLDDIDIDTDEFDDLLEEF
ncbi:MAG TPA: hypothetical protein HA327_03830 [Candidatus Poseidoniaceae archaeon]|nr:MAG TPA: hypothetical protein D7H81_03785 [Candidatus Poseidoniales archaeon]HII45147.1 hypothetical protein [Candidatus Poseidoniaceae archaeon]|tara:strand:+ start:4597 stop:5775 length:1179 start_codon:yes stop_codon:yes gene_type:complete